jgi:hypothetical protein
MRMDSSHQNAPQHHASEGSPMVSSLENPPDLHNENIQDHYLHEAKSFMNLVTGGCLAAVVIALCHHTYLSSLDGIEITKHPQFWVKSINNFISQVEVFCITVVALMSLLRAVRTLSDLESC